MKKGFLTLILAGSLMSAGAENALTGTKFTDNWSVGINAGVTQPLAHPYSIGENIRPQVGVELYKQFTPVFKTGVEFNAGINTTGIYGNRGVRTAFDHANLNLLGGLNLMNLFGGYKGSPRVFEIEALEPALSQNIIQSQMPINNQLITIIIKSKYYRISLAISIFGCIFGCRISNTPSHEHQTKHHFCT